MNGSIYNGRSAILSFQDALSIESNNVSNVNTVGFKYDSVSFQDMMYQDGVGKGTLRDDPIKNFSQGSIKPSNSEYDFAISGLGFFALQDPVETDKIFYSRTGQFHSDNENFLTNSEGLRVMGVKPVVTGDTISSNFSNNITSIVVQTDISTASLNTYTTNYDQSAQELKNVLINLTAIEAVNSGTATQDEIDTIEANPDLLTNYTKYATEISQMQAASSGNDKKSVDAILNDIDAIITDYTNALKLYSINPIEGETSTKAQSSVSYADVLDENSITVVEVMINGVKVQQNFETDFETTMNLFSDKINNLSGITSNYDTVTKELAIDSLVSGQIVLVKDPKVNEQKFAVNKIQEAEGSGKSLVDALYLDLQTTLAKIGGVAASNKSEIVDSVSGTTPQLETIQLDLNVLGMSTTLYEKIVNGDPLTVAAYPQIESEDGNLYLTDGDARFLVGRLLPVTFTNVSDLIPQGDNVYTQGRNQKDPIYIAGSAEVMGRFVESSNIDLSESLVNLMVWQKGFEANSKTVTTSDELLKTALALKK